MMVCSAQSFEVCYTQSYLLLELLCGVQTCDLPAGNEAECVDTIASNCTTTTEPTCEEVEVPDCDEEVCTTVRKIDENCAITKVRFVISLSPSSAA